MTHDTRYSTREDKSRKIMRLLKNYLGNDLSGLSCIDVGCADGGITIHLASHFNSVFGMDIDPKDIAVARENSKDIPVSYAVASAHHIPFLNESFDVVICAQVYEHVSDQSALSREIWRIIKPGGICFFSGPNRLKVMEEHYWLPFLSWLPRSLSNLYLRVFRKVAYYDAYPLYYWQLLDLWKKFEIKNCMPEILRQPENFSINLKSRYSNLLRILPRWLIQSLAPIYPNYNWILRKNP